MEQTYKHKIYFYKNTKWKFILFSFLKKKKKNYTSTLDFILIISIVKYVFLYCTLNHNKNLKLHKTFKNITHNNNREQQLCGSSINSIFRFLRDYEFSRYVMAFKEYTRDV